MKRMDEMMDSLENAFLNDIDLPEETLSKREIRRLQKKTLGKIAPKRPALRGRRVALIAVMAALLAVISVAAVAANSGTVSSWFKGNSETDKQTEQEMELLNQIGTVWDQSQQIGDFKVTLRATYGDAKSVHAAIEIEDTTGKALSEDMNFDSICLWVGEEPSGNLNTWEEWSRSLNYHKVIRKDLAPNCRLYLLKDFRISSDDRIDLKGKKFTFVLENLTQKVTMSEQVTKNSLQDLLNQSQRLSETHQSFFDSLRDDHITNTEEEIVGLRQPMPPIFQGNTIEYVRRKADPSDPTREIITFYVKQANPNTDWYFKQDLNYGGSFGNDLAFTLKNVDSDSHAMLYSTDYFGINDYRMYDFEITGNPEDWLLTYPEQEFYESIQEGKWTFQFENVDTGLNGVTIPIDKEGVKEMTVTPTGIVLKIKNNWDYTHVKVNFKDGTFWRSIQSLDGGGGSNYREYNFKKMVDLNDIESVVVYDRQDDPGTTYTLSLSED